MQLPSRVQGSMYPVSTSTVGNGCPSGLSRALVALVCRFQSLLVAEEKLNILGVLFSCVSYTRYLHQLYIMPVPGISYVIATTPGWHVFAGNAKPVVELELRGRPRRPPRRRRWRGSRCSRGTGGRRARTRRNDAMAYLLS